MTFTALEVITKAETANICHKLMMRGKTAMDND